MTTLSNAAKVKRAISYEEQVRELIREKVDSGEYASGEKIPSSREIAASFGTNSFTVHNALNSLQKEGLLVRYPRKGTFVASRDEKLTCVGVYSRMSMKQRPFCHAVREVLKEELHKDGIEMELCGDTRPSEKQDEAWEPLIRAAEKRRFQAFIGIEVNEPTMAWQRKLPVPLVFMGAPSSVKNNVDHDMRQFFKISLGELATQGCRSIGLISPVLTAFHQGDESGKAGYFDWLEHFLDVAGDLGLIVKNDWMRVIRDPSHDTLGLHVHERFGYEQFLELWSQSEKPEGLLIFDDVAARGAITAIREKQVRVPDELKLVLHKNESIDLFCPMPVTFVVSSEREIARALIEQVKKQFRGESCERISLPFKLMAHNNP